MQKVMPCTPQMCRKCKQGHQDHAERDNACIEAYAQQDEDKVFEDYFQVQVAPCNGLMHGVQYLMLFHELQARADWESRVQLRKH